MKDPEQWYWIDELMGEEEEERMGKCGHTGGCRSGTLMSLMGREDGDGGWGMDSRA